MVTVEQWCNQLQSIVGTPFQHQGRSRYGVDCYGLMVLAAEELGIAKPEHYQVGGYRRLPGKDVLMTQIGKYLKPRGFDPLKPAVHQTKLGDILVFRIDDRSASRHMGVYTKLEDKLMYMVHADGKHKRVLETRITSTVWMARLTSIWYYDQVTGEN